MPKSKAKLFWAEQLNASNHDRTMARVQLKRENILKLRNNSSKLRLCWDIIFLGSQVLFPKSRDFTKNPIWKSRDFLNIWDENFRDTKTGIPKPQQFQTIPVSIWQLLRFYTKKNSLMLSKIKGIPVLILEIFRLTVNTLYNISTYPPLSHNCLTFGGSQSQWSIFRNSWRWLAVTESKARQTTTSTTGVGIEIGEKYI